MPSTKLTLNKDLEAERKKCTFNVTELTNLLDGDAESTEKRRKLENFFLSDPAFKDTVPSEYLSHKERYEEAVRKSCLLVQKIKEWEDVNGEGGSVDLYQSILGGMLGSAVLNDGMPFALHYVMFIPTLMGQATLQQQAYWIGRAWNCEIIGTYAQTELGHGTYIRGLETTATYDPKTEEFVLNSPTLTSYKWWPGGLGHTANYALVVAQLYSKGECHGIHVFIVQLRDEETHHPLPGIKIGEIGAKMGMNAVNNGYLGFENVRIPRDNMLMKNAKVLPDGTYVKSVNEKLTYGTMIFVRVTLVRGIAASYLAKAVTIATRYSAVRRQSKLRPEEEEPLILEYKTQQYKLIPNIAATFAMHFSAKWIWEIYNEVTSQLELGDLDSLPELHAMACCLKALCTFEAARGVEECRKSCGGHGYMACSNLPISYAMVTAAETYEGENTVLYLQTARYLLKACQQAKAGRLVSPTTKYLMKGPSDKRVPWRNTLSNVVEAFEHVASGLVQTASEGVDNLMRSGKCQEDAWNLYSIHLVNAAEAHCRLFMVQTFVNYVNKSQVSSSLRTVLTQLCELYAVNQLLRNLGYFLMYSNIAVPDVKLIEEWQDQLLEDLRPNAVSLVDSFDIPDEIIKSPLGAYDGNVYERLFKEANRSPLNQTPVNESFQKYLKPFLKSNM